ncbi:PREDICTED: ester hydrolase C11orf54 homolog [Trachymyrmex cornetzi]|uniref:Ester hydrolase C11orf54 like protein n=1 Tax=Trachymyrmex cornetzi TaxID=471704 RepID=A0A195EFD9_9HYME|nr:PREDICTED: ester hydrolase C11orf54 homolog [Trachymyrmex cornetzi]KYN26963.1 Ester hydrolase C11orf54 like protein [Trachymyrmex cornetzi]
MVELIIPIDLYVPEKTELAIVLQNELSTDFEEVTVEWVDCPDLTQEPFNLAAPGLCGDIALLDIGGISNLFPFPIKNRNIYFKNILQELDRTQSDNLIIGGGLCTRKHLLHELIMNASFSPAAEGKMTVNNKSCFAATSGILKKHFVLSKSLANTNPYCNIYGNFFVSKGLREQVLKVHAKHRTGRDFIVALQHAIKRFSKCSQLMGFGGTFIIKNGKTIHHVIQNDWKVPIKMKKRIHKCIKYWKIQDSPVVAFATFVSADRHKVMSPKENIYLNRWHVHANSNDGGGYYHETEPNNSNTEYLGYFSPATKLYRINPVPIFREMINFTCLRNH